MARPKVKMPAMSYHLSGQAICQIDGTFYYLGEYGSPAAIARYAILIREYQANGMKVPPGLNSQTLQSLSENFEYPEIRADLSVEPIKIKHLMAGYESHAKKVYSESRAELYRIQSICREIIATDGELLASEYGPRKLKEQRERWVQSGKCRKYCNRLTQLVISIFGWGVSDELVEETTWTRLKSVTSLRYGQTIAPESVDRIPAKLDDVRKTIKELSPILRAMVRIQVSTGMRPTELCIMRPCDIDKSGKEWLYRPSEHKTASRGKERVVPIVDDAREALEPFMERTFDSYCFSPKESMVWWLEQKRALRKSKVQPSQVSRAVAKPQVKPSDRYTQNSYRVAIYRACDRVNVERWFPYQLRHLNLTEVREALTAEHAQAIGGHSRLDMTMTYAKAKIEKAIEAAKHAPKL